MRKAFFASSMLLGAQAAHNIMDYGAVPEVDDVATAFKNGDAIAAALYAANAEGETDREVLVPAGYNFTFMPVYGDGLTDLTLTIDGTLLASTAWKEYPL